MSRKTASGRSGPATSSVLRVDAARNVALLREAAINAFRGHGLNFPLGEIAKAAGVSKGTLYNRFGGRQGLIEAVIEELVATDLYAAIAAARSLSDPWEQLAYWVKARRDLQFREPAFTDVMLMVPLSRESKHVSKLAKAATLMTDEVVLRGRAAGVLRPDVLSSDLFWFDLANGLALQATRRPSREDYDRRTRVYLDSLRLR